MSAPQLTTYYLLLSSRRRKKKKFHRSTMATELPTATSNGQAAQDGETNFAVKAGLARMLKGGVIMDVVNAEQVRS